MLVLRVRVMLLCGSLLADQGDKIRKVFVVGMWVAILVVLVVFLASIV